MLLLFSTFELCMFLARVFRFAFRFACWDAATQLAYRFASRFACWGAAPQLAFGFSSHLLGRVQPHSLLLDLLLDLLSGLLLDLLSLVWIAAAIICFFCQPAGQLTSCSLESDRDLKILF